MLAPCRDCRFEGRCEQQNEIARRVLFSWAYGALTECGDREERYWHGVEGVKA